MMTILKYLLQFTTCLRSFGCRHYPLQYTYPTGAQQQPFWTFHMKPCMERSLTLLTFNSSDRRGMVMCPRMNRTNWIQRSENVYSQDMEMQWKVTDYMTCCSWRSYTVMMLALMKLALLIWSSSQWENQMRKYCRMLNVGEHLSWWAGYVWRSQCLNLVNVTSGVLFSCASIIFGEGFLAM